MSEAKEIPCIQVHELPEVVRGLRKLLTVEFPFRLKMKFRRLVRTYEEMATDTQAEIKECLERYAAEYPECDVCGDKPDSKCTKCKGATPGEKKIWQDARGATRFELKPETKDEAVAQLNKLEREHIELPADDLIRASELGPIDADGFLVVNGKRVDVPGDAILDLHGMFLDDSDESKKAARPNRAARRSA